jgi:type VI secretion system protein ImpH
VNTEDNDVAAHPERFDLFRVLRDLERSHPDKPRIGDSAVLDEEVVNLAQDPFLAFPFSNISEFDQTRRGTPRLHTRFLGFFGPQGALPLTTTFEAFNWHFSAKQDHSFTRFVGIFANRFQQLFFRAWADARPIAQHDRPRQDRFARYVGSFAGIGSDPFAARDTVDDLAKLPFAGLVASRVKSARRLCQLIRGVFRLDLTVTERIGSWLLFEPNDRMALGAQGSSLGVDTFLGERAYSINDKFRINIRTSSLEEYMRLLPNEPAAAKLRDLVFFYLGHRFEYDVELALPARCAPGAQLGVFGQLGWTSWVSPPKVADGDERYFSDARFDLQQRRQAPAEGLARAPTGGEEQ